MDIFVLGGPTKLIKPKTTELLGSLTLKFLYQDKVAAQKGRSDSILHNYRQPVTHFGMLMTLNDSYSATILLVLQSVPKINQIVKGCKGQLTTELWCPPLVDFGTNTEASSCVCLELVTQHLLLTVKLTHVIHTALKEWCWIYFGNTLPGKRKKKNSSGKQKVNSDINLVFKSLKNQPNKKNFLTEKKIFKLLFEYYLLT